VARQIALEKARGEFLCMLDSDDWIYPNRVQNQVDLLLIEPSIALVSSNMVIVDRNNDIVGIRASLKNNHSPRIFEPEKFLRLPRVSHAASMVRMEVAKMGKYDPESRYAEDVGYLIPILNKHRYCIDPKPYYVYSEHRSVTVEKIKKTHAHVRNMFRKYQKEHPVMSRVNIASSYGKVALIHLLSILGFSRKIIERRSVIPDKETVEEYYSLYADVRKIEKRIFTLCN